MFYLLFIKCLNYFSNLNYYPNNIHFLNHNLTIIINTQFIINFIDFLINHDISKSTKDDQI